MSDRYFTSSDYGSRSQYSNKREDAFIFEDLNVANDVMKKLHNLWYGDGKKPLVDIHFWVDSWENPKFEKLIEGLADL